MDFSGQCTPYLVGWLPQSEEAKRMRAKLCGHKPALELTQGCFRCILSLTITGLLWAEGQLQAQVQTQENQEARPGDPTVTVRARGA